MIFAYFLYATYDVFPSKYLALAGVITGLTLYNGAVIAEWPGVPVADRERIFEPFFRNQMARKSTAPGHGLGLAICQSIVLAHGGEVTR